MLSLPSYLEVWTLFSPNFLFVSIPDWPCTSSAWWSQTSLIIKDKTDVSQSSLGARRDQHPASPVAPLGSPSLPCPDSPAGTDAGGSHSPWQQRVPRPGRAQGRSSISLWVPRTGATGQPLLLPLHSLLPPSVGSRGTWSRAMHPCREYCQAPKQVSVPASECDAASPGPAVLVHTAAGGGLTEQHSSFQGEQNPCGGWRG